MHARRPGVRQRSGFSLGSVLLLATVVLLISVSIAALAGFQLSSAQQSENSKDAFLLAESDINQVVSDLTTSNGLFGQGGEQQDYVVPGDPSRFAHISFGPGPGPISTNFLKGTTSPLLDVLSGGVAVQPETVRIVATGHSHGLVRQVEAIVAQPLYPYGLSCGGTLSLVGAQPLVVQGAGSLARFVAANGAGLTPILPASIACLGNPPFSPAVAPTISGSLYSLPAPVPPPVVPAGAVIGGEVRTVPRLALPAPNVTALVTAALTAASASVPAPVAAVLSPGPALTESKTSVFSAASVTVLTLTETQAIVNFTLDPFSNPTDLIVTGPATLNQSVLTVTGNLTVNGVGGDLVLNHSLVYVNGNVTVTGAIRGSGVVMSGGNVVFASFPGPTADINTEVAVLAQGNVQLTADATTPASFYQGLIYAGGTLTVLGSDAPAHQIIVGGVLVAQGNVSLTNTIIWHIPTCAHLIYAAWMPQTAAGVPVNPLFGTVNLIPGPLPQSFGVVDSQPVVGGSFFSGADVTNINTSAQSVAVPAYTTRIAGGVAPLSNIAAGPETMTVTGLTYDTNINRFVATRYSPVLQFTTTRNAFDTQAVAGGTTTEELLSLTLCADQVVHGEANKLLSQYENAGLTVAPVGTPGNLPTAIGAQFMDLELDKFLPAGSANYTILAERIL